MRYNVELNLVIDAPDIDAASRIAEHYAVIHGHYHPINEIETEEGVVVIGDLTVEAIAPASGIPVLGSTLDSGLGPYT